MRYLSIDIETTGINPDENQMIEFGAIIEDSNNPKSYEDSKKFRRIILARDKKYFFNSFAAKLNAGLIELISDIENSKGGVEFFNNENLSQSALFSDELIPDFKKWLYLNGFGYDSKGIIEVVAAGKNFASFDKQFIKLLNPESSGLKFNYRSIDPATYFIDWNSDLQPPSSDQCLKRAGISGQIKHEALSDAWNIIQLLRTQYGRGYKN